MTKPTKVFLAIAVLLMAGMVFAQIPGKYLGFTANRFWANSGAIRTDNTIESYGTSNALKATYGNGVYATLAADSAGSLTISRASAGTLKVFTYQADAIDDDGTVNLPSATSGMCFASCGAETVWAVVAVDGSVVLGGGSTNIDDADTDAKLDVFDGGTYATVKNRLGAAGEIRVIYFYN